MCRRLGFDTLRSGDSLDAMDRRGWDAIGGKPPEWIGSGVLVWLYIGEFCPAPYFVEMPCQIRAYVRSIAVISIIHLVCAATWHISEVW